MSQRQSLTALGLVLASALLLAVPSARAGAVYETREAIPTDANVYRINFDDIATVPGVASTATSGKTGAGLFFKDSMPPLAVLNLAKCATVSPHVHPNAAEMLYVVRGRILIHQFRGEEDGLNARVTEVKAGAGGYIEQGSIHAAQCISKGGCQLFRVFDHVKAGVVFVSQAMTNLNKGVVNGAFNKKIIDNTVTSSATAYIVPDCKYYD